MNVEVNRPSAHKNNIRIDTIPGDKSMSHRALMLGSLATGISRFQNFLFSEDCLCTMAIFQAMGVSIKADEKRKSIQIDGVGLDGLRPPDAPLDVGNSGTSIRLMSGILAGQGFDSVISGDASIQRRPMKRIVTPLSRMGASIYGHNASGSRDVTPPLRIKGQPLRGQTYELPVASAQVKSAVLLAGLFAKGDTTVIDRPGCRNHTETMMAHYGVPISIDDRAITVSRPQALKPPPQQPVYIPSDFSSAAFFMVLAAAKPGRRVTLTGVGLNPTRCRLIDVLKQMGAQIDIVDRVASGVEPYGALQVTGAQLRNITLDVADVPFIIDEIPILAVAACFASGTLRLRGAEELRVKESDRIASIVAMVRAFGGRITAFDDGFDLSGPVPFQPFTLRSHGDHRIAMSALIAAELAGVSATVEDCHCIATSFPNFLPLYWTLFD